MADIGFIGLGQMGEPIATHLLEAGHAVTAFDLRDEQVETLEAVGADGAGSLAEVAAAADVVFLCLPGPDAVESVVTDPGFAEALDPGTVVVDTTSSAPATTRVLAEALDERGASMVSAPLSGGTRGAEAADLTVMVGGSEDSVARVSDLIDVFGGDVFHVGTGPAQGHIMKLVSNYLSFSGLVAASEAIALGEAEGIEMDTLLEVINASAGRNFATEIHFPKQIANGTYGTGFPMKMLEKDVHLYTDFAEAAGMPAMIGDTTRNMIGLARVFEGAEADMTRVYDFFRDVAERS